MCRIVCWIEAARRCHFMRSVMVVVRQESDECSGHHSLRATEKSHKDKSFQNAKWCDICEEKENQQDATIKCLLSTSVSTCFGHHYAHLQENKDRVTACGVLLWFCWMWWVAVVGRCVVGCEHIYIYIYIHTYIHTHIYIYICIHI